MSKVSTEVVDAKVDAKVEQAQRDKAKAESAKGAAVDLLTIMQSKAGSVERLQQDVIQAIARYHRADAKAQAVADTRRVIVGKVAETLQGEPIDGGKLTFADAMAELLDLARLAYGESHKGFDCKGGQSSAEYADVVVGIGETATQRKARLIASPI